MQLLNDLQIDRIIAVGRDSVPSLGPTEIEAVVRWAERTVLETHILNLMLKGFILPVVKGGEVEFYIAKETAVELGFEVKEDWPDMISTTEFFG